MTPSARRGALLGLLVLPAAFALGWGIGGLPGRSGPAVSAVATPRSGPSPASGASAAAASVPARERAAARAPGQALSDWTGFQQALAQSQTSGRAILLDFGAAWCRPCRAMKNEVFDDPFRGEAVRAAVIPVSLEDRRREEGQNPPELDALQRQYAIEALPTLIVVCPATGRSERLEGWSDAERTLAWIQWAAGQVTR